MDGTMREQRLGSALVVDDHPLFCDALSMTLRSVAGIEDIATAGRLSDALEKLRDGTPDIVVLDLHLPDVDGMSGLVRLRQAARAPILVVSSMTDDQVIGAALGAGAAGYVPKHSKREVFRAALAAIARGEPYTPEGYAPRAAPAQTAQAATRLASLTQQQARILELICEGKLNKQIAYDLSIAETTVKAHVTAIMRKLGVQSRTQAVLLATEARFKGLANEV